jgi:hypothetical protein
MLTEGFARADGRIGGAKEKTKQAEENKAHGNLPFGKRDGKTVAEGVGRRVIGVDDAETKQLLTTRDFPFEQFRLGRCRSDAPDVVDAIADGGEIILNGPGQSSGFRAADFDTVAEKVEVISKGRSTI